MLAATSRDEVRVGTVLRALDDQGHPVQLRIDSIVADPRDAEGEIHLYGMSLMSRHGWIPYCEPDFEGRRAAIPVNGAWASSGHTVDAGADALTFACTSGAIGKCIRLGYAPWRSVDGGPSMSRLHSACVRMIRADYCGDGTTHTVDGTLIDIADVRHIQNLEPSRGAVEVLEAGWSEDGATYLHLPRLTDDVAAIVRECPRKLAHRTSLELELGPDDVVRRFPETLLVNRRVRRGSGQSAPSNAVSPEPATR